MERVEVRNWLGDDAELALREVQDSEELDRVAERRALGDQVFGQGFCLPGGEAELVRLVRPLHLTARSRLMVIGAGVAGPCRTLAKQLGLQASGFERSAVPILPETVPPVTSWVPGQGRLPSREFHFGVALNPLRGDAPEPVLAEIAAAIRPGGQILLVDYVATDGFDPAEPAARDWLRRTGRCRQPDSEQDLARALGRLGLHLRATEDLSRAHGRLAVFDWRRMLNGMHDRPNSARCEIMLDEAESWRLLGVLLREDQLRLLRFHAALPPGPPG